MPDQYIVKVRNALSDNNDNNIDRELLVNIIVDSFYKEVVTEDDQALFNIAFSPNLSQVELDKFLNTWDIEKFGGGKALLLSYVMKLYPELKFTGYEGPRLAGLLKFFRFRNLDLIAHFTKIGRELNVKDIIPMIIKGGAMKFLRPELSRNMGDIDILLQNNNDYQCACDIAKGIGYEFDDTVTPHSVDLHVKGSEAGVLDIHSYLDFGALYDKSFIAELFSRAKKRKVFGVESYIPSNEDMVFICLANLTKNLRNSTSVGGILYTLFDCDYLKSSDSNFNWNIIVKNAVKIGIEVEIYIAIIFVNRIIPGFLPQELFVNSELKSKVDKFLDREFFYAFAAELKKVNNSIFFKDHIGSLKNLKFYLYVVSRHFFIKKIRKRERLAHYFVRITSKFIDWNKACV